MTPEQFAIEVVSAPTMFELKGRSYRGCDCWGLVVLAYKEVLGIELPSYDDRYVSAKPDAALSNVLIRGREELSWIEVQTPMPLDVVLLRLGGALTHCALAIGSRHMLHVMTGTEACLERWSDPLWKYRLSGFWRHPERGNVHGS